MTVASIRAMIYHSILRPGAQRQLKKIGDADLVIGLPTYKNPQSAARVARIALDGVHQHYPHLRTILINADAGHKATTRRAVMAQASQNGHNSAIVSGRYDGVLGYGSAIAALLDAALALDAKAIIILDSHTHSIDPNWVAGLAHLILENKADLVIPRYRQWGSAEGLLSDLIIYPLFRTLWGKNIRRPAAPDFALAPQLAHTLLDEDIWGTAVANYGLSPWLATYAVIGNWKIAQSALSEKLSQPDEAGALVQANRSRIKNAGQIQLEVRFHDILSVIFSLASRYLDSWQNVRNIQSISTLTEFTSAPNTTENFRPDTVRLLDELALGWIEYRILWKKILTPDNLAQIEALAALSPDQFYFPADLWARIIYDFLVVFNKGDADPYQIINALFPLFKGRVAAFCHEVDGLAATGREGTVAAQAVELEEARPYLRQRWQSYQPDKYP